MHTSSKIVTASLVGFILGGFFLTAAQAAWVSPRLPDCNLGPVLGRRPMIEGRSSNGRDFVYYDVNATNTRGGIVSHDESRAEAQLGPYLYGSQEVSPGRSIFDAFDSARVLSNITYFGVTVSPQEVLNRLAVATFNNVLKVECRLQVMSYYMGFTDDMRINDLAVYDPNTRNHSLYQRTNDLQEQIAALSRQVQALSTQLRMSGMTTPSTGATGDVFISPTTGNVQSPSAAEILKMDAVMGSKAAEVEKDSFVPSESESKSQVCLDRCSAQYSACAKRATNAKALQSCDNARISCEMACS